MIEYALLNGNIFFSTSKAPPVSEPHVAIAYAYAFSSTWTCCRNCITISGGAHAYIGNTTPIASSGPTKMSDSRSLITRGIKKALSLVRDAICSATHLEFQVKKK